MKATGIVRRIDDLGRIVIPKEIRRTLRLHEGDPMELYLENDGVLFKKYSPMSSLGEQAAIVCRSLATVLRFSVVICDMEEVLALS